MGAGTLWVSVKPSLEGFGAALRAQIEASIPPEIKVRVRPDDSGMAADGAAAAGKFADAFKVRLDAAMRNLPKVRIDADSTPAEQKLAALRFDLESLRSKRIGVDVGAAAAQAELNRINVELDRLAAKSPTVEVRVNAAAAAAELRAFATEVDRLDGRTAKVKVDTSEAQSGINALLLAGLGLGPALIPIGAALTASVVALGPAAIAAAGALGSIKLAFSDLTPAITAQGKLSDAVAKYGANSKQAATATKNYELALSKLSPAGREFVKFYTGELAPKLDELKAAAQTGLLPGLEAGIKSYLSGPFAQLKTFITNTATAVGTLAREAGAAFTQPFWRDFFNFMNQTAGPALVRLGEAFGNLVKGAAGIMQGLYQPVFVPILDWFTRFSQKVADFGAGAAAGTSSGFNKFLDYVKQSGPQVVEFLKQFGILIGNIVAAFAGQGVGTLTILIDVFKAINSLPPQVLQLLVDAFLAAKAWGLVASGVSAAAGLVGGLKAAAGWAGTMLVKLGASEVVMARLKTLAKGLAIAAALYAAGEGLKAIGANNPNAGKLNASIGTQAKDVADTAGRLLTLDFAGVFEKLKRDWLNWSRDWANVQNSPAGRAFKAIGDQWNKDVANIGNSPAGKLWQTAQGWWADFKSGTAGFFTAVWRGVADVTSAAWRGIGSFLTSTWNAIKGTATAVWAGIGSFFSSIWNGIAATTRTAWSGIGAFLSSTWNGIRATATAIWSGIATFFSSTWNGIRATATTVWNAITDYFHRLFEAHRSFFMAIWNGIASFFTSTWNGIKATATTVWSAIAAFFTGAFNAFKAAWNAVWTAVLAFFTSTWNTIRTTATSIWNAIASFYTAAWNAYKAGWNATWTAVSAFFTSTWNAIRATATSIWNAIASFYTNAWNAYKAAWNATWTAVSAFFTQTWNAIRTQATSIWNSIAAFFNAAWNTFKAAWNAVWTAVLAFFTSTWNTIRATAISAWNAISSTITGGLNALSATWRTAWTGIANTFTSVFSAIEGAATRIWGNVKQIFVNGVNAAVGIINGFAGAINVVLKWLLIPTIPPIPLVGASGGAAPRGVGTVPKLAAGGPIALADGGMLPGYSPGIDTIPAMAGTQPYLLAGGEYIVRPEATRALGPVMMQAINRAHERPLGVVDKKVIDNHPAFLAALSGQGPGHAEAVQAAGGVYADPFRGLSRGGPIGLAAGGAVMAGLDFARAQGGKPYVWGGVGPMGYDCSGFMSAIANVLTGRNPYSRLGSTGSAPWAGWSPGLTSEFGVGWFKGNPGHMAGTLAGQNVESGSGHGPMLGGRALGATARMFSGHMSLPQAGGVFTGGAGGGGGSGIDLVAMAMQAAARAAIGPVRALLGALGGKFGRPGEMTAAMITKILDGIMAKVDAKVAAANAAAAGSAGLGGPGGPPTVGGSLLAWIQAAERLTGVGPSWTPGLTTLIMRESGGNPNAINRTDSNARAGHPSQGLMQTIPSTFAAYHQAGTSNSITDPVANIAAGINYIKARYGGIQNVQQANPNMAPRGYDEGGWLKPGTTVARNGTARPEAVLTADQWRAVRSLAGSAVAGRGVGGSDLRALAAANGGVEKRLDDLHSLLKRRGAGAQINVQDRSGDPTETARATMLALRLA